MPMPLNSILSAVKLYIFFDKFTILIFLYISSQVKFIGFKYLTMFLQSTN